jgi:hypothetical protein
MVAELLGTTGLVAIYIPEGTEAAWGSAGQHGRVMGAVQLLPMPEGLRMESFPSYDLDGVTKRWPIGWPSRTIYAPPPPEAYWPRLRDHVQHFGWGFGAYVARFQQGPFKLEKAMQDRLNDEFRQITPAAVPLQYPPGPIQ